MKWASAISVRSDVIEGIGECVEEIGKDLSGPPDLGLLFVSHHFSKTFNRIGALVKNRLSCKLLIGCSAGGVIGAGKEVEGMPGISLTAGELPGVSLLPFHMEQTDLPSLDGSPRLWEDLLGIRADEEPHFLLLADPFSISPEEWLSGLDFAFPKGAKVGGLASGAVQSGKNALFLNEKCHRSGMIGVALSGNLILDTAVAQGCYPVGPVLSVTLCEDNVIKELDGRSALEVLADVVSDLSPEEQELIQHSLFVGIVMDSMKKTYSPGDFLIRNLVGADTEEGHLVVAARLHEGQTIQFHIRDAQASASDLDCVLSAFTKKHGHEGYSGALLFSCLGRGQYLYGYSNHDSERFRHYLGALPLGGFFCNGEIGPVDGMTHLHGYTSSFGLFRPKEKTAPR